MHFFSTLTLLALASTGRAKICNLESSNYDGKCIESAKGLTCDGFAGVCSPPKKQDDDNEEKIEANLKACEGKTRGINCYVSHACCKEE